MLGLCWVRMQGEPPGWQGGGSAGFLGVHSLQWAPGSPGGSGMHLRIHIANRFPDDDAATGQPLGDHCSKVVDRSKVSQSKHINKGLAVSLEEMTKELIEQ